MLNASAQPRHQQEGVSFEVLGNALLCTFTSAALENESSCSAAGSRVISVNDASKHLIIDFSRIEYLRAKDDVGMLLTLYSHQKASERAIVVIAQGEVAERLGTMFHQQITVVADRSAALSAIAEQK